MLDGPSAVPFGVDFLITSSLKRHRQSGELIPA